MLVPLLELLELPLCGLAAFRFVSVLLQPVSAVGMIKEIRCLVSLQLRFDVVLL